MKRREKGFADPFKFLAKVFIVVFFAVSLLFGLAYRYFDNLVDAYQPTISKELSKIFGAEFSYTDLKIKVFPVTAISVKKLKLLNPKFNLETDELEFQIDPFFLLFKKIVIEKLHIKNTSLVLDLPDSETPPDLQELKKDIVEQLKADFEKVLPGWLQNGLSLESIEVANLDLVLNQDSKQYLKLQDAHLSGLVKISDENFEFVNLDCRAKSQFPLQNRVESISAKFSSLTYNFFAKALHHDNVEVVVNDKVYKSSGEFNFINSEGAMTLEFSGLDYGKFKVFLAPYGVEIPNLSGILNASLELGVKNYFPTKIKGELFVTNLKYPSINLSASEVLLKKIIFTKKNINKDDKSFNLSFSPEIKNFYSKESQEIYKFEKLLGKLKIKNEEVQASSGSQIVTSQKKAPAPKNNSKKAPPKNLAVQKTTQASNVFTKSYKKLIQGEINLSKFSFVDNNIDIRDVSANLTGINGFIDSEANADFSLNVQGNSIKLNTENFSVEGLKSLDSNLTISIPSKSGYKISGNAKVAGGDMTVFERKVLDTSGDVQLLISSPIKTFKSSNISVKTSDVNITAGAAFEMNSNKYILSNFAGNVCGGKLQGEFSMERKEGKKIQAKVVANKITASEFLPLFLKSKTDNIKGNVEQLILVLSAQKGNLLESLVGQGRILVANGLISKFTADAALIKLLNKLPFLDFEIKDTEKKSPANSDTKILIYKQPTRRLVGDFTIKDNKIFSEKIKIFGRIGTIDISGSYNFGKDFQLQGDLIFLEQNLRMLGGPIKPLGRLFGNIGKIIVPFKVSGPIDDIVVGADLSRIMAVSSPTRLVGDAVSGVGSAFSWAGDLLFGSSEKSKK